MLRIKPGVALLGMRPEILLAVIAAEPIWYQMGTDLTITSCTEGVHSKGSRHYSGLAIDLRTRGLSNEQAKRAGAVMKIQFVSTSSFRHNLNRNLWPNLHRNFHRNIWESQFNAIWRNLYWSLCDSLHENTPH